MSRCINRYALEWQSIGVVGLRASQTRLSKREICWPGRAQCGGNQSSDMYDGCRDGSECTGRRKPFCDTVRGKCVASVSPGRCAARDSQSHGGGGGGGGGASVTLFAPESVAVPLDPASSEHELARRCAEYLPEVERLGGGGGEALLCCRADDRKLRRSFVDRWQEADIQFGQCDNCLRMVRQLLCQVACDRDNYRFFVRERRRGSDTVLAMPPPGRDASICDSFCTNVYLACRHVVWNDTVRYLYDDSRKFCSGVLQLDVVSAPAADPLLSDWGAVDAGSDANRLCTPTSRQHDIHCVGAGMHGALGTILTLVCTFAILAELVAEKVTLSWVPGATVMLCFGVVLGMLVKHVLAPLQEPSHLFLDIVQFNTNIFGFLLLPVIIFSSSFNMEHHASVFFHLYIQRITLFAVLGTLVAIFFTGGMVYAVARGTLSYEMSVADCMMFGSLVSAVDPVATLTAFASVGIDPRVYSMIYGESILNDAVAIVLFGVFKEVAEADETESDISSGLAVRVILRIALLSLGSLMCGLLWGLLVTLMWKVYGLAPPTTSIQDWQKEISKSMVDLTVEEEIANPLAKAGNQQQQQPPSSEGEPGRPAQEADRINTDDEEEEYARHHVAMAEAAVFVVASICSYYVAEALHVSGIISALCCGIVCKEFGGKSGCIVPPQGHGLDICHIPHLLSCTRIDACSLEHVPRGPRVRALVLRGALGAGGEPHSLL
jgi:hypothetical protein